MLECPYCSSTSPFEVVDVARRPDQRVERCTSCLKHSVVRLPTRKRYKLDDPDDPHSPPHR